MLLFRAICALLMAWAINYALSRPEASALLLEVPEFTTVGPIAGAAIGFVSLSTRQGWGLVVAIANGIWAGVLSLALASMLYVIVKLAPAFARGLVTDFEGFLRVAGSALEPLMLFALDFSLILTIIGATAVVGVLSEILHWTLVKLRERSEDSMV